MLPDCITLPDFDMIEFVQACASLSITSYIWQPPETVNIRVDTRNPVRQSDDGWKALSAIYRWADHTDPGSHKRNAFYQKAWEEREPGQQILYLDKQMSRTSDEAQAASDED
jgi:hypothetical protein